MIGLTGGIASGKTTVSRMLAERGATVIDADVLGHEIYRPGMPAWDALIESFGCEILGAGGQIDRRKLGALVFGDPEAMRRLTAIVWPLMKVEMQRDLARLRELGTRIVVLEAAVLIEAGWQDLVDEVWTAAVPPHVAVGRLVERNGIAAGEAWKRLAAQISNNERIAHADVVIDNSGRPEELSRQVDALWQQVLRRAA